MQGAKAGEHKLGIRALLQQSKELTKKEKGNIKRQERSSEQRKGEVPDSNHAMQEKEKSKIKNHTPTMNTTLCRYAEQSKQVKKKHRSKVCKVTSKSR